MVHRGGGEGACKVGSQVLGHTGIGLIRVACTREKGVLYEVPLSWWQWNEEGEDHEGQQGQHISG